MYKLSINNLIFSFNLIIFRVLLDISYIFIISQRFAYMDHILNINYLKLTESYILIIILSLFLPKKLKKASDLFIVFLFSMISIPLLSLYGLKNESRIFVYMIQFSFIIIIFIINFFPKIKIPRIKQGKIILLIISLISAIFIYSWIAYKGGFSYFNLNFLEVYNYRSIVSQKVFYGNMAYLMSWYGKVINIFLLVFFLKKKSYLGVLITLILQILFFGVTTHKSMLFYPVFVFFVYYGFIIKNIKKNIIQMLIICLNILVLVSITHYFITDNILLVSFFIRRVFYSTAINHYRYFNFAKEFGYIFMSDKFFVNFIEYPYKYSIPHLISSYSLGHPNAGLNTGFLANGYIHFGFLGMILYSFVLSFIFIIINSLNENIDLWITISLTFVTIYNLVNSDLLTVLLTHGLGLSLVFLWLFDNKYILVNKLKYGK